MKGKKESTRKLQKIGDSICMTIPRELIKLKGWKVGDTVKVKLSDKGELIIKEWHNPPKLGDFV